MLVVHHSWRSDIRTLGHFPWKDIMYSYIFKMSDKEL